MPEGSDYMGAALVGGIIALGSTLLAQLVQHRRDRDAARRSSLRDAYAEWAAQLEAVFDLQVIRAWKVVRPPEDAVENRRELKAHSADLRGLKRQLKALMYSLLFLETSASRREIVKELTESVLYDSDEEWDVFMQEFQPDGSTPGPPYAEGLARLFGDVTESGLLQE